MSMKISVQDLEVKFGNSRIDYQKFAESRGLSAQPYLEISFIDEEEGKIGFYAGVMEETGALIDRTTANSIKKVLGYLAGREHSHATTRYAMKSATITIDTSMNQNDYTTLSLDVTDQFFWEAELSREETFLVSEAIQYALDQYEAVIAGEASSETAGQAARLLTETSQQHRLAPDGPVREPFQAILIQEDWGSDPG